MTSKAQAAVRLVLGSVLVPVGVGHLALGCDTELRRVLRLPPQPALIVALLASTGVIGAR